MGLLAISEVGAQAPSTKTGSDLLPNVRVQMFWINSFRILPQKHLCFDKNTNLKQFSLTRKKSLSMSTLFNPVICLGRTYG